MGKEKGAGKNAMVIKTRGFYLHSELPVVELKKKKNRSCLPKKPAVQLLSGVAF